MGATASSANASGSQPSQNKATKAVEAGTLSARKQLRSGSARVYVTDFGADPSGKADSTNAFMEALSSPQVSEVFIPNGVFRISSLPVLGWAGKRMVGASRWKSVLLVDRCSGPFIYSREADLGTSAFHQFSDFLIDLSGSDRVAVDLASINASTFSRIHIRGKNRVGTGVRFAAPLKKGAYDNAIYDCSFEQLDRAVSWEDGANTNSLYNPRALNCRIAFDTTVFGVVDTPRIFGGRCELCDIGLREGAQQGSYFGVRFERNALADIEFTESSLNASFFGGATSASNLVIKDMETANSPSILASDLGHLQIEENASRPRISTGRHIFGKTGKSPAFPRGGEYSAFFSDPVIFGDDVVPEISAQTNLGTYRKQFGTAHFAEEIRIGGKKVVSHRQSSIADDRSNSQNSDKVNQILATLRAHGLIEE